MKNKSNTAHTPAIARGNTAAPANKTASSDEAFFQEETDPATEARNMALEVITRFLIWTAEGTTARNRGARATIALYCVRPDLLGGMTLEKIGDAIGITKQAAHKLAKDFRANMGI